jgi:hypothetical protein
LSFSRDGSGLRLVLALAAAWSFGCDGRLNGNSSGPHSGVFGDGGAGAVDGGGGANRDGGAADGGTGALLGGDSALVDGGGGADGGEGGGRDGGGSGGADGGAFDAAPSPWVDLVTRVTIDAEGEITEDKKVSAAVEIHRYDNGDLVAKGIHVGIKIRGHFSVGWPKKNYAVEVWDASGKDSDFDFLGMGAGEDWVLHGPYVDRTLLHNAVIYQLSNQIGRYAPEIRFASVALRTPGQSAYKELGAYVFMEQIRFSKERLQIDKTSPDGSKKAFLMQINGTADGTSYRTTARNTPITFIFPPDKSRTTADEDTALAMVDQFEASLDNPEQALSHIDQSAAVDYFILNELARNPDGFRNSYHFYIPIGGLITFGPIWDYDLAFGISQWDNGTDVEGWQYAHPNAQYFPNLLKSNSFKQLIKARWQQLRKAELSDTTFENLVRADVKRLGADLITANNKLWPLTEHVDGISGKLSGHTDYDQVVQYMVDYGKSRMQWIDGQIKGW